jgi:hypothetical protein
MSPLLAGAMYGQRTGPGGGRRAVFRGRGFRKQADQGASPNSPAGLGTQTMEGVIAQGTRQTTTWPPESQGFTETWYSPELKAMVLSKTIIVNDGESTLKLIHISGVEADPALFQPPPDYTIADDNDSVTLNLKRP